MKTQNPQLKMVENSVKRNLVYSKRKRGILKKAIELSQKCKKHVFLAIFDSESRHLLMYTSNPNKLNESTISKLNDSKENGDITHEVYSNNHYNMLAEKSYIAQSKEPIISNETLKPADGQIINTFRASQPKGSRDIQP